MYVCYSLFCVCKELKGIMRYPGCVLAHPSLWKWTGLDFLNFALGAAFEVLVVGGEIEELFGCEVPITAGQTHLYDAMECTTLCNLPGFNTCSCFLCS